MGTDDRRTALKKLLTFSWLGATVGSADLEAATPQPSVPSAVQQHRYLGVQVLRFLNTAQVWTFQEVGRYLTASQLKGSPAVERMRTAEFLKAPGLGGKFIETLDLSGAEIASGWRLHLFVPEDRLQYIAVLENTSATHLGGFATDQRGVIVELDKACNPAEVAAIGSARDLPGARLAVASHQHGRRGGLRGATAYLASLSGAAAPRDWCWWGCWGSCCACSDFVCCFDCTCHCQTSVTPPLNCYSCGCASCIYACCP